MIRVLIVEDNRFFREALKTVCHERLPSVINEDAANGEEALKRINEMSPDLLFMDMRLDGMNGLELAKKIKGEFTHIRIAILTGYDFPEYRRMASQYGVDRYFIKDSLDWKEIKDWVAFISDNREKK